jgi:hypothetical protein
MSSPHAHTPVRLAGFAVSSRASIIAIIAT